MFPHPCLYAGDFNCCHADWDYDDNSPDGVCLAGWASINCLALLYNAKDAASFYSDRWNTGTNPNLAFASIGPNSRLPDRHILEKFHRSQHRPLLLTPPRFAMAVPSMPVKQWNFRNTIKQPKRLFHTGIKITIFHVGMQSVNPSIKPFCKLLRETTQVWLLQLCLPNLTESRGIDGPRQFRALNSHTWSNLNNLTGRSQHSPHHCPISADAIASQLVRNKKYEAVDCKSSRLVSQKVSDLWKATTPDAVKICDTFSQREFAAALQHLKPGKPPGSDFICSRAYTTCWSCFEVLVT